MVVAAATVDVEVVVLLVVPFEPSRARLLTALTLDDLYVTMRSLVSLTEIHIYTTLLNLPKYVISL